MQLRVENEEPNTPSSRKPLSPLDDRRPLSPSASLNATSANNYASEASVQVSAAYLADVLAGLGLGDGLNLTSSAPADVAATCNALNALVLQHRDDAKYREQLQAEVSRARAEAKAADRERARLEAALGAKERELGVMANKARTGDDARKEEVSRARREADDLQKRLLGADRRLVQMQHEIKRKEKEYERLQERLSHYLADKKRNEKAALEMAGQLVSGGPGGAAAKASARSDEGLRAVVAAYEARQAESAREIRDLRAALASLQGEYKNALNAAAARREADAAAGPVVEDSWLALIATMSADELRAELAAKLKVLQRRLANLSVQAPGREYSSVAEQRLASDLAISRSVIADQEQLIAKVLSALRAAQIKAEAEFQAEARALAMRYQGQLAAAETALERAQADVEAGRLAAADLERARAALESTTADRDDARRRLAEAEAALAEAERERRRAVAAAAADAEGRVAAATAAARREIEVEMERMAAESSELQLSLKREQATLRAETGALRERLVKEKTAADKALAERDEALAGLAAAAAEAERRGAAKARSELQATLDAKDAAVADLERRLADTRAAVADAERRLEEAQAAAAAEAVAARSAARKEREEAAQAADAAMADAKRQHVAALAAAQAALARAQEEHAAALAEAQSAAAKAARGASQDREQLEAALEAAKRRHAKEMAAALEAARADAAREQDALRAEVEAIRARSGAEASAALTAERKAAETERRRLEKALAAAEERANTAAAAVTDREASLRAAMEARHTAELEEMRRGIAGDRAALLAKAESDFREERETLVARVAQMQAQLEVEAARAAEAAEVRKKYDEVMWHYRELMKKMAPGMGAGAFLEKGVQRRAAKLADAVGATSHGRSRR